MNDDENTELYVCKRTSDLKDAPGALKDKCSDCGQEVWIMPTAPTHMKIVCMHCTPKYVNEAIDNKEPVFFMPGHIVRRTLDS